jgi:hypothetical protein
METPLVNDLAAGQFNVVLKKYLDKNVLQKTWWCQGSDHAADRFGRSKFAFGIFPSSN